LKGKAIVLDTSAFIAGFDPLTVPEKQYTVPEERFLFPRDSRSLQKGWGHALPLRSGLASSSLSDGTERKRVKPVNCHGRLFNTERG